MKASHGRLRMLTLLDRSQLHAVSLRARTRTFSPCPLGVRCGAWPVDVRSSEIDGAMTLRVRDDELTACAEQAVTDPVPPSNLIFCTHHGSSAGRRLE